MKGSNSRLSHDPSDRYSNVAHVQGGMVTDADLTASGQIHQTRDEAQNIATMWSGCPEHDGAVSIDDGGNATLQPGWIVAQGKQGWLAQVDEAEEALPLQQADLPLGPSRPEGDALYYADLWERPVFAAQDRGLTDPGLHGAETSYRTRTMVQVKALPLADEAALVEALAAIEENTGLFARTGNAKAKVTPRNTEIATDDCDPCADQIDITPTVPNALFRFEVISVAYDGDAPSALTVAWSMENASAIVPASTLDDPSARDAFARPNAVYEFFSDATEAQIGRFANHDPERPVLTETLFPAPAAGGANGGAPYGFVRRWDGCAEINLQTRVVTNKGVGSVAAAANDMTLTLDAFALQVTTKDSLFLAGDYWLVELRRFAVEAERVRLASENPSGIAHHFCPLFKVVSDGSSMPLTDEENRRLTFPALSDIPATHVSFDPACPPLFHNAENVADALNALCDLNATEVAFDPGDNCPRFEGTSTVDEALKRMCQIQDDTTTTRILRLMMDWGVVCGIRLKHEEGTKVSWTGGTMLDRSGRLIDVKAGSEDLRAVPEQNILSDLAATMKKDGELCLSMAVGKEGQLELYISDRQTAFGPVDRTFLEAVEACLSGKKRVDFDGFLRPLKPEEGKVVKDMVQVWTNRKTLAGSVPMSEADGRVAIAFNKTMLEDYRAKAAPERVERVEKLISLAETEYNPGGTRGANREILRMQLESAKLGIIANSEEEDRLSCECDNALVPCPPDAGEPPYLVPVACFRTDAGRDQKITNMQEFCTFCCRKQSQNWRSQRYYFGSVLERRLQSVADRCCTEKEPPNEKIDEWIDKWDTEIFKPIPIPIPLPEPEDILWPPKIPPKYEDIIVNSPGGRPGLVSPIPGKDFVNVVNVETLPPARAKETLVGNGFDVVETINLDDASNPLEALKGLGLSGNVRSGKDIGEPGDKIAMLVSGGKTVDYVVVEKGTGRLPFETDTELTERVTKALEKIELPKGDVTRGGDVAQPTPAGPEIDLSAFDNALAALEAERKLAENSILDLASTREALSVDVGKLQEDLTSLSKAREATAAEIAKSNAEFAAIEARKAASLRELTEAVSGLEKAKTEAAAIGRSIRAEQPARVLLGGNDNAVKALENSGVASIGDITSMNTSTLTALLRRSGVNMSGSALKAKANELLNRP